MGNKDITDNIYTDDARQYIQMMQENITRMANNSANCKLWLITIVSALIALSCDSDAIKPLIWIAAIPIFVFWFLDTYYLHLERGMRNRQREFLNKMRQSDFTPESYSQALFDFTPFNVEKENKSEGMVSTRCGYFSISIAPFYILLLVTIIILSLVFN